MDEEISMFGQSQVKASNKNGKSFRFGQSKPADLNASEVDAEIDPLEENISEKIDVKEEAPEPPPSKFSRLTELKVNLHRQVLDKMNLSAIDQMTPEQFRESVGELVQELVEEADTPLNQSEKQQLVEELINEILGLGPLEPLLADPTVTDILINTFEHVFVERGGRLYTSPTRFKDDAHLRRIIDKIVSTVGRRVDESQPLVDARLKDGSRVNAVIPPVAVDGPLVSIRKFAKTPINMDKLIEFGALPNDAAELLRGIVGSRRNVLISGGTGSGKTTMLNAMSAFIDTQERIVTIEDAAELQLQQIHVARLETRVANIEGKGEVTQRELVKNALRMRPDRIIVGEVRGGEAFDMLQAMNTGHDGSMTTIHANTCRDALSRLEQMISMAHLDISAKAMREQIASAVNVIIQVTRLSDGSRRMISLNEVTGMEGEVITLQEIIKYERHSVDDDGTINGNFIATGIRPEFITELETRSIAYPEHMFNTNGPLE
jgi:pilus assembly protein CpaF